MNKTIKQSSVSNPTVITLSASQIQSLSNDISAGSVSLPSMRRIDHHSDESKVLQTENRNTLIDHTLILDREVTMTDKQAIESSLRYALSNGLIMADELTDVEYSVYKITEEKVDVLSVGIDSEKTIVGYAVVAFNPNDECAFEYTTENNQDALCVKNCFTAIIDYAGVSMVSSRIDSKAA